MAGKLNPARRHHVVPQFYLRHWTREDGRLWIFHADREFSREAKPSEVGFVKDFHSLTGAVRADAFEHWLGQSVEGPLATAHRAILTGINQERRFPTERRTDLDRLVAYQMLRLPRMRERLIPILKEAGWGGPYDELAKSWHLDMLGATRSRVLPLVLDLLHSFHVSVLRAPVGRPFWTSDAPVVIMHEAERAQMSWRLGLGHPKAQVFYPLSPQLAVLYFRVSPSLRPDAIWQATRRQWAGMNEYTVANAAQLVFSPRLIEPDPAWMEKIRTFRAAQRQP
ncbi:DUF4238 domain-containing protein [Deinococcus aquatilis]|uniref:DUF4238 domain-containing protein n=1 Tax=Deinococcus aquatilis TaxID=519440 RepID=UPI0003743C3A|nr:DUF4238 domain-containing protein [Deinococcus aquatilis]